MTFYLVENRDPTTRNSHNLVAQQVDVDALDPVRLHVLEAEPREVAGARADAAQGVFRYPLLSTGKEQMN